MIRLFFLSLILIVPNSVHAALVEQGVENIVSVCSDGKTVYVALRDENKMAVVSAADLSIITKIDTDGETHGVAYRDH